MVTVYDMNRIEFKELEGKEVEDCRVRQFYINLIHCITGEALSLFEKPIKLIAILCLWWPVNLYG